MTVHKEGYQTIALCGLFFVLLNISLFYFLPYSLVWLSWLIFVLSFLFFLFIISFFRVPKRTLTLDKGKIIAPADGKVVVIEEAVDEEYFKDKRLQVSIFMSPANVHQNLNPVSGEVVYSQYHKGKYLVAWDPKSSTDNERHSVVIAGNHPEILVKQIAGAVARRIVNYLKVGQKVQQGGELGFIKFGSRVDILLPVGTKVEVKLNEVVKGGITVLASWGEESGKW
jgi:phosphatidylserine decarboxylase